MRSFESRLRKVEDEVMPGELMGIFFARKNHKEEDIERQREEYRKLWGSDENFTSVILRGYSDKDDYETFIAKNRAQCSPDNFLADWWQRDIEEN